MGSLFFLWSMLAPLSTNVVHPQCYDFQEVNVPGRFGLVYPGTSWWDVNNENVFVGNYCIDMFCSRVAGAVYDARDGSIETFQIPGYEASIGTPHINEPGQIVGTAWAFDGSSATWLREPDGSIRMLDLPDFHAEGGINNRGDIAGFFYDEDGFQGAVISGRDYDEIEYYYIDGAEQTALWGINDSGDLLPTWEDYPESASGYLAGFDDGSGIEWLEWLPQRDYTVGTAWGLNNRDQIVGAMLDPETGDHPGFVKTGKHYQLIRMRGEWTAVTGINEHGVLSGTFDDYRYGFVAFPRECAH